MKRKAATMKDDEHQHAAELLELGDAFFEMDHEWRIVRVNGRQELLSRLPRSQTVGRTFAEVWPELAGPQSRYWREYRRCMDERVPVQFQEYYAALDMWTGVTAYPVSGGGVAVFFRDITDLKRAEEAKSKREVEASQRAAELEAVLSAVADGVLVYDVEGRIVRSNAAADEILEYSARERAMPTAERLATAGITWLWEDGTPVAPERMPAYRAARFGERFRGAILRARRPAVERWVRLSGAPLVLGGERIGAVLSISEISEQKRVEHALRESEARARTISENIRDLLVVLEAVHDGAGAITGWRYADVNEGALELLGARREDVVGRTIAELLPDSGAQVMARLAGVMSTGEPSQYEREFGGRTLLIKLFRIGADRAGSAAIDITQRKRAEEALRESESRHRAFFHSVMELAGVHEVVRDDAGNVVDSIVKEVNEPTLAFLGVTRERVLGRRLSEIVPAEVVRALTAPWAAVLDVGTPARYELELGGHVLFVSASRMNSTTIAAVASDVTERKRTEEALRERDQALRDADRRKDEFLGMLSHELRNPLAPIRNALYILDHAAPTGEQARRAKEVANRQIAHITRLVDDLLDVTRIARGKIELRRVTLDLSVVARRTVDDYRTVMRDRGLDLALDLPREPVLVSGDETRLSQIFGNLLSNAAKFTPPGGQVAVTIRSEGGCAVARVRDTGPGIPPDVLPTMFEPFTQGKQTLARAEGGLGLGLALVKGLATLHGGQVGAISEGPGRGSEFTVTLPLAASAEDAAGRSDAAREKPPATPARRVLVIDDNRDAADTLAQLVAMLGHHPVVAYDAISALARAVDDPPDVVLCDLGLPGMDGYEFARQLRASSSRRPVRLVAISGYAQPEDVARAMEAGFDAHVPKPPDPDQLVRILTTGTQPAGG